MNSTQLRLLATSAIVLSAGNAFCMPSAGENPTIVVIGVDEDDVNYLVRMSFNTAVDIFGIDVPSVNHDQIDNIVAAGFDILAALQTDPEAALGRYVTAVDLKDGIDIDTDDAPLAEIMADNFETLVDFNTDDAGNVLLTAVGADTAIVDRFDRADMDDVLTAFGINVDAINPATAHAPVVGASANVGGPSALQAPATD
jgi:hypothetical protein